ncbi:hypothetical protein ABB37_00470 [Leptomonas pyrrhocoris]|uniref:Uncharacterized protein n=1 Tax=Leptomonas pyrrhocoris TaxID=157538 RepID=A0A0M9GAT8_LEPPY|nr:hypothetical protein ABB37_00470 [Leptomonas pyrrhocoris]XP_015664676.1 hypothetical protein ABB37_00470 [Leptomonas pyrrhocoris]KPA86236.1 hypothetical protein ABB37_00470 [Leptomonas pyrrhocoris]KPA86237.1 hypothetical protein ABB37_00470 [Leptomonas pyrrhocoris]|eukprot:XP_015664675.1 hypothetical protein ABB37_00470 [Leptomonas pyrrhocoris]
MNSDDVDALRSELLRQKLIFDAELRRQRESFEERLSYITQELADREADCRNLQSVITILGRKVDAITELKENGTTPRPPTPRRNNSMHGSPFSRNISSLPSPTHAPRERARTNSLLTVNSRRASPQIPSGIVRRTNSALARVASTSALSRTESPHVFGGHQARPLLRTNTNASVGNETGSNAGGRPLNRKVTRRRTNSAHRLTGVKATGDW